MFAASREDMLKREVRGVYGADLRTRILRSFGTFDGIIVFDYFLPLSVFYRQRQIVMFSQ